MYKFLCPCNCNVCNPTKAMVVAKTGTGYRTEILTEENYEKAANLILEYYLNTDILCKSVEFLKDSDSVNAFIDHILQIMASENSLVVIDENNNNEVVGVLLLSVVRKIDFGRVFSNLKITKLEAYDKIIEIKLKMLKEVDFFEEYKTERIMRFYLICIHNQHRTNKLGMQLFRSGFELCRHQLISYAIGTFSSKRLQKLAESVGFHTKKSIRYDEWKDESGNVIFGDLPRGEEELALMVATAPPAYVTPIVYEEIKKVSGKTPTKEKEKNKK